MSKNFNFFKNIVDSYEVRIQVIDSIAEDTKNLLKEFRKKRERMSEELKTALAQHESLRKKDFDKMMEEILIFQKEREENVKQMLADFQEQEMAVVKNLREMLKRGKKLRVKDFKKTLAKIKEEQEIRQKEAPNRISQELFQMQSEIQAMLVNFKKEREKVASEWKSLLSTMAEKKLHNNSKSRSEIGRNKKPRSCGNFTISKNYGKINKT